ncbi:hypothetical protein AGMMS49965_24370 [Bacteroidia bacterium]|nr:hypothetical protein AGMMS49965_24370 [Bacteroidia bacterium]
MDKTNEFLYFIENDEGKILAIKMVKDWESCQAFIYDMKTRNVEQYVDKGPNSFERKFFAGFLPYIDSVKTPKKSNDQEKSSWKWLTGAGGYDRERVFEHINKNANDIRVSTTWKESFEYWAKHLGYL